jgi:hypothetical protein
MKLEVTPRVGEGLEQALRDALAAANAPPRPDDAWQRAGIDEAVERGDYAFSPRSTRGATRA